MIGRIRRLQYIGTMFAPLGVMANIRVLIATTSRFRDGLLRALAGCPVDFVCSMDEGREALQRRSYTHVIIGYLFAESAKVLKAGSTRTQVVQPLIGLREWDFMLRDGSQH